VPFQQCQTAESEGSTPEEHPIGVVAQEIEAVLPELVSTSKNGYKSVDYTKLTAVLIETIKELKTENERLQAEIDDLRNTQ
jgi:hypothetical protein